MRVFPTLFLTLSVLEASCSGARTDFVPQGPEDLAGHSVAVAATVMVIVCLEAMNFLHHRVFKHWHKEYDADEKEQE